MKLTGKIEKLMQEVIPALMSQKKDKVYELEIKVKREKRKLNQNDKFYKFQNELAEVLGTSNEELHFELLKRYSPVILATLPSSVNPNGYFKYYEEYKRGITKGNEFISYKVYKPSSEMDTKEFARLLTGLLDECREVGIETMSKEELESLLRSANEISQ